MSDALIKLLENTHKIVRRLIINYIPIFIFWCLPFILFKPETLNYPIYVQFILVFTLSFAWFGFSCLLNVWVITLANPSLSWGKFFIELSAVLSLIFLCFFILASYYLSDCFTMFLKRSFITIICLSCGIPTFATFVSILFGREKK